MSLQNLLIGDQFKFPLRLTTYTYNAQQINFDGPLGKVRDVSNGSILFDALLSSPEIIPTTSYANYVQIGNVLRVYFDFRFNVTATPVSLSAIISFPDISTVFVGNEDFHGSCVHTDGVTFATKHSLMETINATNKMNLIFNPTAIGNLQSLIGCFTTIVK